MAVMDRERWTDDRIDERLNRVDADIRDLRLEMKKGFEKIDNQFERVDDRFDSIQGNMMTWAIALFSTVVSLNAAVIAAVLLS